MMEIKNKRHYKDITLKIEVSSESELLLDGLVQKLIVNLNNKTTKTVKDHRVSLDSYSVNTFPRK